MGSTYNADYAYATDPAVFFALENLLFGPPKYPYPLNFGYPLKDAIDMCKEKKPECTM